MENNNLNDEFLVRYLAGEADAGERDIVERWIAASEQNRQLFESLQKAWQLAAAKQTLDYVLEELNVEEKWTRFLHQVKAVPNGAEAPAAPEEATGPEWEGKGGKSIVRRLLVAAAIAASVLLVAGLGWKFFLGEKPPRAVAINKKQKTDSLATVVRQIFNTTGREKRIQLPDGTLIVLADRGEVTYQEPFHNRNIALTGKAYFKVVRDQARPFTVRSGDIATTDLGTEFTVTTLDKSTRTIVRLYEGKVVVSPVDRGNAVMKKDVYLDPGQELVYNRATGIKVRAFKWKKSVPEEVLGKEQVQDNPLIPQGEKGSWYMFNNQSLEQVLNELSAMYNVRIVYDKRDIRNIYFTGQYNRADSLDVILHRIGALNNLTITRNDTAYIIGR